MRTPLAHRTASLGIAGLTAMAAMTAIAAMAATLTGCATSLASGSGSERVVVAVDAPPTSTSSEVVEVTEIVPPVAAEAPPARRRLSQTVTLGQGTPEPVYVPAAPQQQGTGGNGPSVVVNNNVTVVNDQPYGYGGYGYGGYYGGYGYGYGGYGRGGGAVGGSHDGRGTSGTPSNGAWAPNGWEGAQRTAAPGRTPGVGGNWAPPPSFGPRTQK